MFHRHTYLRLSALFLLFSNIPALHVKGDTIQDEFLKAIQKGDLDAAKELVGKPDELGDLNEIKDNTGELALPIAIRTQNEDMVKLLLDNKADPNKKGENIPNYWGVGPGTEREPTLHVAIKESTVKIVKLLLKKKAAPNKEAINHWFNKFEPALHVAINEDSPEIVKLLLENEHQDLQADANAKNLAGNPALHAAIEKDSPDMVASLLEAGADANVESAKKLYPLLAALGRDNEIEMITSLLEHRAEVNGRSGDYKANIWEELAEDLGIAKDSNERGRIEEVLKILLKHCEKHNKKYEIEIRQVDAYGNDGSATGVSQDVADELENKINEIKEKLKAEKANNPSSQNPEKTQKNQDNASTKSISGTDTPTQDNSGNVTNPHSQTDKRGVGGDSTVENDGDASGTGTKPPPPPNKGFNKEKGLFFGSVALLLFLAYKGWNVFKKEKIKKPNQKKAKTKKAK